MSFGTSGHRGSSLAGAFNEAHILAITQAICDYRAAQGITGPLFVGKDTHALSTPAEKTALQVFAANGVTVDLQITTAQNITVSVRWLEEASHTVRLDLTSSVDGMTKGNIETPAVPMMPTMPSALVTMARPGLAALARSTGACTSTTAARSIHRTPSCRSSSRPTISL